ncbi:MAG: crossover junction endodeoxyribonuclease RuvC [Deltaproteobacteria bacterium]|nr:crossover junction endodeoxyribonuclease RuvC [Deltaproteobacteria bacterium]MBW1960201.1 crossover junction endodeoxyribonuclease RuvC [Deltaproteobacteria bacterium]MBW2150604.1 crossover junction endodeoxyribonuclease RuvC [Deltaproteobacteria bacterium]
MITVVGIDPGLAATGVGIVRGAGSHVDSYSFGNIHTSKHLPLPDRLDRIFSRVMAALQDERPDLLVVEDVFSLEKYPASGIILGKVSGVILLASCRVNVPVVEISVREVKQVLTGNGSATKLQLESAVRHFLNLSEAIRPSHAADAMALALIGLLRYDHMIGQQDMGFSGSSKRNSMSRKMFRTMGLCGKELQGKRV